MKFFVTADRRSYYIKALDLVEAREIKALIADKGYGADLEGC